MWKSAGRRYTINYYSNVESPSNMPDAQNGVALPDDYNVTLSSNAPTLSGYRFMGWCTSSTRDGSCSGTVNQPNASITILNNEQTINLYAIWHTLPATCNSTGVRLKDGKCWSKSNVASYVTWSAASSYCKSPWRLPSLSDFNTLLLAYYPSATARDNFGDIAYRYTFNNNDGLSFLGDWDITEGNDWWSSDITTKSKSAAHQFDVFDTWMRTSHCSTDPVFTSNVRCVSN